MLSPKSPRNSAGKSRRSARNNRSRSGTRATSASSTLRQKPLNERSLDELLKTFRFCERDLPAEWCQPVRLSSLCRAGNRLHNESLREQSLDDAVERAG